MSFDLPKPGPAYDFENEAQLRSKLEQADLQNQKRSQDITIVRRKLILVASDGSKWSVHVSTSGVLSTVAV